VVNREELLWEFFFGKLLQNFDAAVMISDPRGRIVFANRKYLRLVGLPPDDMRGSKWIDGIIPPDDRPEVKEIFAALKKEKTIGYFVAPAVTAKKKSVYLRWISFPLKNTRSLYMFVGHEEDDPAERGVRSCPGGRQRFKTAHGELVKAFFAATKKAEPNTAKHSERVMMFAEALAKKMRISRARIENLKTASLLHDMGKLAVDEKILFKKGRLNRDEFAEIIKHPHRASEAIEFVGFLHNMIPIMANHHENYDGSGYPRGLKGENIPLESRILMVADIYEALTADRPYRRGFSSDRAVDIMEEEKGVKLDPRVTDIFLTMVREGRLGGAAE